MLENKTVKSSRATVGVNSKLDRDLTAYIAAAGAAGVGMLALTQSAQAKVVYTPANTTLNNIGSVPLDLNGDGVADINFLYTGITYGTALFAYPVAGNGVIFGNSGAAALPPGVRIGPGATFSSPRAAIAGRDGCHPTCASFGDWLNKKGAYLGIKFSIAGQTHYGWARLSVSKVGAEFAMVLTGYAYETVANQPIITGRTRGPEVADAGFVRELLVPSEQPASLAVLARGADSNSIWRREEEKEVVAGDRSARPA